MISRVRGNITKGAGEGARHLLPLAGLFENDLRLDTRGWYRFADPPVEVPPPAILLEWSEQATGDHAKPSGLLHLHIRESTEFAQERRQRKSLMMRSQIAQRHEPEQGRKDVFTDQ